MAKRLRELLTDTLPDEIDELLTNMRHIRDRLKGDFAFKVKKLNKSPVTWFRKKNRPPEKFIDKSMIS